MNLIRHSVSAAMRLRGNVPDELYSREDELDVFFNSVGNGIRQRADELRVRGFVSKLREVRA